MARVIPASIHPNVRSGAEQKLFGIIRDTPGTDDWVCLHSLGLARHARKRRGEIDFLLLTRKGVFVLEVKGGRVSRRDGVWEFTDRYGIAHEKHESPFDQASSAMFALERDVQQEFRSDQRRSRLLFCYGVMLPDIIFNEAGCEADLRLVYDARDRHRPITDFIERLSAFARESDSRNRYAPTDKDIQALVDFLRPDFDLVPPLGVQADAAADKFLSLEREQYAVIDAWEQYNQPRVLVQGGAGTGKTLLALEAAVRAAQKTEGKVLLLCYNRLLARFLEENAKTRHLAGEIQVKSIYSLLNDLISASSFSGEFMSRRSDLDASVVYQQLYPEYASLALIELNTMPAKTLVIDEAQDMMTIGLLDVIDAFVEGGLKSGQWRIFCDVNNQASVFGAFNQEALERLMSYGQLSILATNRRNTKPVAEETAMLTRPRIAAPASIAGIPVQYNWYKTPDAQGRKLSSVLKCLHREEVAPGRITVLSARNLEKCCAASISNPNLVPVQWNNVWEIVTGKCPSASYCTISAFKGLENDFIILTDIEDLESDWWRSVIYVGMSRARVGLYLLMHESLREVYETRLRQWMAEKNIQEMGTEQ
ncbi:nuclease-related domain-containing DEAD/DEAH box helicase [Desulfatitalea tepidiphila]|uniref:nuclease-related domain-containing DEAD/DEAH box helicase n=1 Tax=Desulfatitalea tepidiphila TaxID=1185843 RepID=UPI0006B69842|nr:NERD domain-containing protein [Desulfatitalea tepidiphila]